MNCGEVASCKKSDESKRRRVTYVVVPDTDFAYELLSHDVRRAEQHGRGSRLSRHGSSLEDSTTRRQTRSASYS